MGKFKNQNLKFKTDEAVIFGSGDEASIGYDGTDLTVDVPILGSAPTKDDHLATKKSVDDADTAVSGAIDEKLAGKSDTTHGHAKVRWNYADETDNIVEVIQTGPIEFPSRQARIKVDSVEVATFEDGGMALQSGQRVNNIISSMGSESPSTAIPTEWAVTQYVEPLVTAISGDITTELINHLNDITPHENYLYTKNEITTISGDIISYGNSTYADEVHSHTMISGTGAGMGGPWANAVVVNENFINFTFDDVQQTINIQGTGDGKGSLTLFNGGIDTKSTTIDSGNPGVSTVVTEYSLVEYITSVSGVIVGQIPTDYISDAEMTTISGDIVDQIPSLSGYATDAEVSTISGDIIAQIPSVVDFVTDAEITVISGDIVSQIPTDYITDAEMTTISGDILTSVGTNYVKHNYGTGTSNLVAGTGAGASLEAGSINNVLLGYQTGNGLTTGDYNVLVGGYAGEQITGSLNVALGYFAGNGLTGNNNVFIGYGAGQWVSDSNQLIIENSDDIDTPLIKGDFSANTLTFNADVTITGSLNGIDSNDIATVSYVDSLSISGTDYIENLNVDNWTMNAGTLTVSGAATFTTSTVNVDGGSTLNVNTISGTTSGTVTFGDNVKVKATYVLVIPTSEPPAELKEAGCIWIA